MMVQFVELIKYYYYLKNNNNHNNKIIIIIKLNYTGNKKKLQNPQNIT